MSRKHYREAAAILRQALARYPRAADAIRDIAEDLAGMFKRDNSNFSRQQFFDAIFEETP